MLRVYSHRPRLSHDSYLYSLPSNTGMGVCLVIPTRRFEVWDDLGKLRLFYTKAEALRFCHDDMYMIVHKELTSKEQHQNLLDKLGAAPY